MWIMNVANILIDNQYRISIKYPSESGEKIDFARTKTEAGSLNTYHINRRIPTTAHDNFDHNASKHWQDIRSYKGNHITLVYGWIFSIHLLFWGRNDQFPTEGMYCGPAAIVFIFFMVTQHFSTKNGSKAFVRAHPEGYWDRMKCIPVYIKYVCCCFFNLLPVVNIGTCLFVDAFH